MGYLSGARWITVAVATAPEPPSPPTVAPVPVSHVRTSVHDVWRTVGDSPRRQSRRRSLTPARTDADADSTAVSADGRSSPPASLGRPTSGGRAASET